MVSVELVDLAPWQAAKDRAIRTAKPSLMVFFMALNWLICCKIEDEFKSGNLSLLILFNFFTMSGLQFRLKRINSE